MTQILILFYFFFLYIISTFSEKAVHFYFRFFFFLLGHGAESVLQKFRKTFSLRFQKKSSKESSTDLGEALPDIQADPTEDDSPLHIQTAPSSTNTSLDAKDEPSEQKYKWVRKRFFLGLILVYIGNVANWSGEFWKF